MWGNKLVLGAISLDLFAVLLGGATGLLPVFARDVLHVGPEGFGVLRAAPAVGALVVAAYLSVRPVRTRAGVKMLARGRPVRADDGGVRVLPVAAAVGRSPRGPRRGGHGVGVYPPEPGPDRDPGPDAGRVSAVSTLFIGASNELGEFESGVVARVLGPVGAVAFGGFAAMGVTALWAWLFPPLRQADRLV